MLSSKVTDPRNLITSRKHERLSLDTGMELMISMLKMLILFPKCHCVFIFLLFMRGPALPSLPLPQFCGRIRCFSIVQHLPFILICLAVHFKMGSGRNLYYNLVTTALNGNE